MSTPDPTCGLCDRALPLTFHHLVPRKLHGRRWVKARFTRDELQRGVDLCSACHAAVHRFVDHDELARTCHTVEALRAHPDVARFVAWASRQDAVRIRTRAPRR